MGFGRSLPAGGLWPDWVGVPGRKRKEKRKRKHKPPKRSGSKRKNKRGAGRPPKEEEAQTHDAPCSYRHLAGHLPRGRCLFPTRLAWGFCPE